MTLLQSQQFDIDRAIFTELLACLPDSWTVATLAASSNRTEGQTSIALRIDGLGQSGIALVSDPLQDRVRELFLLNERFHTGLRGIIYNYQKRPDGQWTFVASYSYE